METINMRGEVVSMPMIKVRCVSDTVPSTGFPTYVQVLPELGDVMVSKAKGPGGQPYQRAVKGRYFHVDGTIELLLY